MTKPSCARREMITMIRKINNFVSSAVLMSCILASGGLAREQGAAVVERASELDPIAGGTMLATTTSAQADSAPANPADGKYSNSIALVTAVSKALGSKAGDWVASTAFEFAVKLLGLTGPSEVELAKNEIISAIHAEQADRLVGLIDGSMTSFKTVLSDPANMLSPELLGNVITNTDIAIAEIQNIIKTKNVDVAYQVAPALTVAVSIAAAGRKLSEYPTSEIVA